MVINDVVFAADLGDILNELQSQLKANNISLLQIMKNGSENIMVQCPYHKGGQERKPSAGIDTHTGVFHCFTCGEIHSLQEVISFCFGKTDDVVGAFGWKWLLKNFSTVSIENRKPIELALDRSSVEEDKLTYVSEEELDSYRVYHPYMWKRKMTPEVVEIFDIGYDKSTSCITFPVRDIRGNTLFIARRSVNSKFFNYPPGVTKPVYGLYEWYTYGWSYAAGGRHSAKRVPNSQELIICESMIDAITCWSYGKYAVALNGLGNELQFKQLQDMPVRKFILATDNDSAGMKARTRLRSKIHNKLITEYIFPNTAKDINDLSREEFERLEEIF